MKTSKQKRDQLKQKSTTSGHSKSLSKDVHVTLKDVAAGRDIVAHVGDYIDDRLPDEDYVLSNVTALRDVITVFGDYIDQRPPSKPIELESALAELDKLPIGNDVARGYLPFGSRMPFAPNQSFVGRIDELQKIAEVLKAGEVVAISQTAAVTGLGGIGKTQLATEFVHRYGQFFLGGVHWLNFAEIDNIENEIVNCGGRDAMDLPGFEHLKFEDKLYRVLEEWHKPIPRLLVFDNCDHNAETLLMKWRPKSGGSRVLITSRQNEWHTNPQLTTIQISNLSELESRQLLQNLAPHLTDDEADIIAERLGYFPLALFLAGSFLHTHRLQIKVAMYVDELNEAELRHRSFTETTDSVSPTKHELHVANTFSISWRRLQQKSTLNQLAQEIALYASHFSAGTPIPIHLFEKILQSSNQEDASTIDIEDALRRLGNLGLLEYSSEGVRFHRLVASYVQDIAFANTENKVAKGVVEHGIISEATKLNNDGYPSALREWIEHIYYITNHASGQNAATLSDLLGKHLQVDGNFIGARHYYERSLAIKQESLDFEHEDIIASLDDLGKLLSVTGDYEEARPYLERSLAMCEKTLGYVHPETARKINYLGKIFINMYSFEDAKICFERALDIRQNKLKKHDPETAQILNNFGMLLGFMEDQDGANSLYKQAIAIWKEQLKSKHNHTAQELNNLGFLYKCTGNYDRAKVYYEQSLTIWEEQLGSEHISIAQCLNNFGVLLKDMEDYLGAKACYERAVTIWKKQLGIDHMSTALGLVNLGRVLKDLGDYHNARDKYRQALTIHEKVMGMKHPQTAYALNNMGLFLRDINSNEEAKEYFERALVIMEERWGPDHPSSKSIKSNLANLP